MLWPEQIHTVTSDHDHEAEAIRHADRIGDDRPRLADPSDSDALWINVWMPLEHGDGLHHNPNPV